MKIDILKSVNELMGLGLTWEAASCAVRYFDGMLQADRNRLAAARKARRGRSVRECPRMSADIGEKQAGNNQKRLAAPPARPLTRSLSSEGISSSESKEQAREVVSKKVRKRKTAIPFPEDFAPSESHFAKAAELGCSPAYVLSKCEDMKIWALSNDARKQDWSQTLHGFIRRDADKGRQHGQPNYGQTLRSAVTQLKGGTIAALHSGASGPSPRPALRLVSAGESDEPGNLHSGRDGGAG